MPFHKKHEIARRKKIVADLYLKGYSQFEIGEKVGVERSQISRDLKSIHKEWKEQRINDIELLKLGELSKLDKLEQTYWEGWEASRQKEITETVVGSGNKDDSKLSKIQKSKTERSQHGDPRFLQGIERCIQQRCKILGIEAPQNLNITINPFLELMQKATQNDFQSDNGN